jgi:hypothetical protein
VEVGTNEERGTYLSFRRRRLAEKLVAPQILVVVMMTSTVGRWVMSGLYKMNIFDTMYIYLYI